MAACRSSKQIIHPLVYMEPGVLIRLHALSAAHLSLHIVEQMSDLVIGAGAFIAPQQLEPPMAKHESMSPLLIDCKCRASQHGFPSLSRQLCEEHIISTGC